MRSKRSNDFSRQFLVPTYNLSPSKVTKFLLLIIFFLIFFNLGERVIVYWLNANYDNQFISHYFNFDQESNFPSLYSALTLGFCSYLLALIAVFKKSSQAIYAKHWKALSWIFLFLAIDEACSIHELSIPILRNAINAKGIFYFTWVIPGFFLVVLFLITFRKFIQSLPMKIKIIFISAGAIYVTGALGMELVGGYLADSSGYNTVYGIATTLEELLEMFGIVIFIHGLLTYIQSQLTELHFSLSFHRPKKKNIQTPKYK
ncbi:hypothetical protein [Pleurocapsa sp. PCC 7319]|uniref:hypothetical protein n=1 Tax=Pleurocapsa sp. PCC 7319 TaxID=118161 RepID=UPI000346E1F7|nr:hypothetical protein [Pleurocapsa sp. PCC 7319]